MKQFSDHIRDHYVPKIDIQKKTQLEDLIESERNKEDIKLQKQKELLEKSKIKGMENLDFIRSLNKNKKSRVKETDTANRSFASKTMREYLRVMAKKYQRNY